jgi:O-antigen ligase
VTLTAPRSDATVRLLQLFAITIMVIPSDAVIAAIGAAGFAASLVGLALFATYVAATAFGLHDVLRHRSPLQLSLACMWSVSLASYAVMQLDERPVHEQLSAVRWLLLLAAITGVTLVAAEGLASMEAVRRVSRALVWGGAACGAVAALQFWAGLDLAGYLRQLPGFTLAQGYTSIISRGGLSRVGGTALHPIELGVVAGMLLPLATYLAVHDKARPARRRWTALVLTALALPASVSRSAVMSISISLTVLLLLLPKRQRRVGLCCVPFGLAAVFITTPGLIGTLASFFALGSSDPSVATRMDDYPMVASMVSERPWFGMGGATFFHANVFEILDNQYLKSAIELGLLGLGALVLYLATPIFVALAARSRSRDPELRMLCAALAAAFVAALVCCATFDAFSFPMFTLVHALLVGLAGAARRLSLQSLDAPDADEQQTTDRIPITRGTP